jgi:Lipase (class 3)
MSELRQMAGNSAASGNPATQIETLPTPMSPVTLQEEINAASAVYSHAVPAGATLIDSVALDALDSNSDGFYALAYEENGAVLIAFEGTQFNSSAYGQQSIAADIQIFEGKTPAALDDAIQFAEEVQSLVGSTPVYITGHSLGGAEAEAVARFAANPFDDFSIAGGVTFGAPGLPGYYGVAGLGNLTNYVDYGDPVGNYAHDAEFGRWALTGNHFGTVEFVGLRVDELITAANLLDHNKAQLFQFHDLSHYAADLGLTIGDATTAAVADASHGAAVSQHAGGAEALIQHFDIGALHAHDFLA